METILGILLAVAIFAMIFAGVKLWTDAEFIEEPEEQRKAYRIAALYTIFLPALLVLGLKMFAKKAWRLLVLAFGK